MKKYKLNKNLIIQKLEDKFVIFDMEKSQIYNLNETASFILHKLKLNLIKDEIVKKLIKKYNIEKTKAEEDINQIIKEFIKRKILICT